MQQRGYSVRGYPGRPVCLYKSDGSPSVVPSLACACCEVLCELLHSCEINILVVVFTDIPVFCLDYKLPTTKNIQPQ